MRQVPRCRAAALRLAQHAVRLVRGKADQKIQRLRPLTPEEKRTRCRTVLADWMRYGSTEVQLRDLAKRTAWAVRPA